MKRKAGAVIRAVRRRVVFVGGGFLPEPLSRASLLLVSAMAAFVSLAFSSSFLGLVISLVLIGVVWFTEIAFVATASRASTSLHSPMSVEYTLLLSVAVGAMYAGRAEKFVALVWISMFLLVLAAWLVNAQSGFLATRPLTAANLNTLPVIGKRPRFEAKELLFVHWFMFALSAILVVINESWVPIVLLISIGIMVVVTAWQMVAAWVWADRARWRTLRELRRLQPKVMMPYGGSASFHVPMWEEFVRELKVPYFIETLKERTVAQLAARTDAPIICPSDHSYKEVNAVIPESVLAAFYVHNAAENKAFLQNRKIKSIWVHHGDGDKLASYRSKSADYDYLFVAGQGAIDRYSAHGVHIPSDKFRIVGRPQTESIVVEERPISDISPKTVLYAPTWHGKKDIENYSSLEFGAEIVHALIARDANVIFRPHPASKSSAKYRGYIKEIQNILADDASNSHRVHIWGAKAETEWSVADVANASDAMVSDVSGIVTDYMQSKKPYAMVTLKTTEEEFKRDFPTSRASYVITGTDETLRSALDDMLHSDPLREMRLQARTYYLGGFEGHESAESFVKESWAIMKL